MSIICEFEDLGAHEKFVCGPKFGGQKAVAVLKYGHGIVDFSDTTEWQTAIAAGNVVLIEGIKGSIPDASPVEGESVTGCGSETVLDGFDRTAVWKDAQITNGNNTFYRQLNSQTGYSGMVFFYCQNDEIEVIETKINFTALPATSPESNKEKRFYNVTAKWYTSVNDEFGQIFGMPAGVLNA